MVEVSTHRSTKTPGITLSESAKQHVVSYLEQQKDGKGIRLGVKKTGCSGLSYVIDYVLKLEDKVDNKTDIILSLNDTYKLFIDKSSYPYLMGMHIDYVKVGLNYKFVFVNPNQTGQCGCGESFTVD